MSTGKFIGAISFVGGLLSLLAVLLLTRPWEGQPAAPSFELQSAKGPISSRNMAEQPYVLFFGFTHCPDICPTTLRQVSDALEAAGPSASELKVYFVTVDPERDTPDVMADYLASFDRRIVGLSGTRAQIVPVLGLFRVTALKVPTSSGYVYDHSTAVYLVGRDGRLRGLLNIDRPAVAIGADLAAHAASR